MLGLTTAHGTLLCVDRATGAVVQRGLGAAEPADLLLLADPGRPAFGVLDAAGVLREIDPRRAGPPSALPPPAIRMLSIGGRAQVQVGDKYLSARRDGTVTTGVPAAREDETFGLIDAETLADLIGIAAHDWLRLGLRARIERGSIALEGMDMLRLGDRLYPVAGNFPLSAEAAASGRIALVREGWMADAFVRSNPLVCFAMMGDPPYTEQLRLATESLERHGAWQGDVLVVSGLEEAAVRSLVPAGLGARLTVLQIARGDRMDAIFARTMLTEVPDGAAYGPVLYSDTDVIFDRPVLPILEEVRISGRFSGQTEPWNAMPQAEPTGGPLFAADPVDPGHPYGFNSGVLAMPGGAETIRALGLIRRGIAAWLRGRDRHGFAWVEQAMTNHVLRKLELFDPEPITRTTRLAQAAGGLEPEGAVGFVHFWPASQDSYLRTEHMTAYLAALDAAAGIAPPPVGRTRPLRSRRAQPK